MEKMIHTFHKKEIKGAFIIIGGAAVNNEVARSIGADGYAHDAVRAVNLVKKLLQQSIIVSKHDKRQCKNNSQDA